MEWLPGDEEAAVKISVLWTGVAHLACALNALVLTGFHWEAMSRGLRLSGLLSAALAGGIAVAVLWGLLFASPAVLKFAVLALLLQVMAVLVLADMYITLNLMLLYRLGHFMNFTSVGPALLFEAYILWSLFIVNVYCKMLERK